MKRRILALFVTGAVVAFGSMFSTVAASSANASSTGSTLSDGQATAPALLQLVAERFRSQMGLDSDSSYVAWVDSHFGKSSFGVPLTPSETADLDGRLQIQRLAGPVKAYVDGPGSGDFGGMFFDQQHDGRLVVQFTRNVDAHRAALDRVFARPDALSVVQVGHSYAQLTGVQRALSATIHTFDASATPILLTYVDVFNNTIAVVTSGPTNALQSHLDAQYGPGLTRVSYSNARPVPASYSIGSAPPVYGGQHISSPISFYGGEYECTSGFAVVLPSTGTRAIVTAGHCPLAQSNPTSTWYVGYNSDQCAPIICSQYALNLTGKIATTLPTAILTSPL
jgi:hypothetical protein